RHGVAGDPKGPLRRRGPAYGWATPALRPPPASFILIDGLSTLIVAVHRKPTRRLLLRYCPRKSLARMACRCSTRSKSFTANPASRLLILRPPVRRVSPR